MAAIRDSGLFQQVGDAQHVPEGQIIFEEGQQGAEMYVIVEGEVAITLEGRRIDQLGVGEFFGEMALVDDRPRSATAVAATDCKILPLNQAGFESLLRRLPEFALQVMSVMSVRTRRFLKDEIQRQRMEEELALGRKIQLGSLPARCPEFPGWEFAAVYRAARQVGGDLYDFILSPDDPDRLNLVVGDVTGKGVPAALFMVFSRTIIRAESARGLRPAEVLRVANQHILSDVTARLFLSALYASLDTRTGRLVFANGGLDWPFLLRASSDDVQELRTSGQLLGTFQDVALEESELVVAPGDALVFYTDGVTEARNTEGQFFGERRLIETLAANRGASADALLESVTTAVTDFAGLESQADDLTLVVIRRQT